MDRESQLSRRTRRTTKEEEEDEEEEEKEEEEKEEATDIKSNNPHLAGGESNPHIKSVTTNIYKCPLMQHIQAQGKSATKSPQNPALKKHKW